VKFALNRPGLFRVMFGGPCDPTDPDRAAAVDAIHEYLNSVVQQALPTADPDAMPTAMWALVHGLAFLHLDGKLDASSSRAVSARVRAAVLAALQAHPGSRPGPATAIRRRTSSTSSRTASKG